MSHKMKKNLQKQEPEVGLKNHNPGCVWGIFHNLQQNQWHKVVKNLPRARLGSGKHSSGGQERGKAASNAAAETVVQENADDIVDKCSAEARHNEPIPSHRNSMKSRIKAITDEVCRRKVRHRRSTSYPVRNPADDAIPIPSHHKLHSLPLDEVPEGSNHSDHSHHLRVNYLKQSEVELLGEEPVRDHTLLHGNLIYAIEPSKDDSLHESKLFMNALTLLNMREEMFLKILKDPNSSLATQMHVRQPNLRLGLNKSMSFSAPAPPSSHSVGGHSDVGSSSRKTEEHCEGDQNLPREAEVSDTAPPPANIVRIKTDDRVGLKRFKNIREKIKYVIRDRKKEKNRIMMDALHHKVPFGISPSKKLSEDIEHQGTDFGSSQAQNYKRTSSFDNSLDRYNQLIDRSSSKEAKGHTSEESKLKVADAKPPAIRRKRPALGRILSSPEIRSYIRANNIHDAPDTVSASHEKKDQLDSEDKAATCSASENEKQEEVLPLLGDEPADSKAEEEEEEEEGSVEGAEKSPPQPETDEVSVNDRECPKDEASVSVSDDSKPCEMPQTPPKEDTSELHESHSEIQDMDWLLSQDMIDLDVEEELDLFESHVSEDAVGIVQESQIQQFYSDLMRVEVDDKNKAEFNYVKGVLELSGFSKNEPLGEWQSAEHPLDPSMFDEVGGISAEQQDYYGKEEVICNQLMLFDLINEVLLQVHERSFCYWPTPLTNRSSIHPLPKGSRVLEEVWAEIGWLLRSMPEPSGDEEEDDTDDAVSRDLAKNDGWMNLQLDAECVGIELEELIFDDLLQQVFAA